MNVDGGAGHRTTPRAMPLGRDAVPPLDARGPLGRHERRMVVGPRKRRPRLRQRGTWSRACTVVPLSTRWKRVVRSNGRSPLGRPVSAVSPEGRSQSSMALTNAERGVSPRAPAAGVRAYVRTQRCRVESADGSQLGLPPRIPRCHHSTAGSCASPARSSTKVCPGTEHTGVTCQLDQRAISSLQVDDPSPRLAWTLARPSARSYRSPRVVAAADGITSDGEPLVRDLSPEETARVLDEAAIPPDAWRTDFSRVTADLSGASGGRRRDAGPIPVVTEPRYETDRTGRCLDQRQRAGAGRLR